jgi:hypothetical protein
VSRLKYKYIGDGPFPLHVIGIGVINAVGDILESDEPINHPHFVLQPEGKSKDKSAVSEGEK